MARSRVLLLTRPECHLCESFAAELAAAFPRLEVETACVDDRADWRERFGPEIPVLPAADGSVLCRTRFDALAVRRGLRD